MIHVQVKDGCYIGYISELTEFPSRYCHESKFTGDGHEYYTVGHRFRSDYIYICIYALTNLDMQIKVHYSN